MFERSDTVIAASFLDELESLEKESGLRHLGMKAGLAASMLLPGACKKSPFLPTVELSQKEAPAAPAASAKGRIVEGHIAKGDQIVAGKPKIGVGKITKEQREKEQSDKLRSWFSGKHGREGLKEHLKPESDKLLKKSVRLSGSY